MKNRKDPESEVQTPNGDKDGKPRGGKQPRDEWLRMDQIEREYGLDGRALWKLHEFGSARFRFMGAHHCFRRSDLDMVTGRASRSVPSRAHDLGERNRELGLKGWAHHPRGRYANEAERWFQEELGVSHSMLTITSWKYVPRFGLEKLTNRLCEIYEERTGQPIFAAGVISGPHDRGHIHAGLKDKIEDDDAFLEIADRLGLDAKTTTHLGNEGYAARHLRAHDAEIWLSPAWKPSEPEA